MIQLNTDLFRKSCDAIEADKSRFSWIAADGGTCSDFNVSSLCSLQDKADIRAVALAYYLASDCPNDFIQMLLRMLSENLDVCLELCCYKHVVHEKGRHALERLLREAARTDVLEEVILLQEFSNLFDNTECLRELHIRHVYELLQSNWCVLFEHTSIILKFLEYKEIEICDGLQALKKCSKRLLKSTVRWSRILTADNLHYDNQVMFYFLVQRSRNYYSAEIDRAFYTAKMKSVRPWSDITINTLKMLLDFKNLGQQHIVLLDNYKKFLKVFHDAYPPALGVNFLDKLCSQRLHLITDAKLRKDALVASLRSGEFKAALLIEYKEDLDDIFSKFDRSILDVFAKLVGAGIDVSFCEEYLSALLQDHSCNHELLYIVFHSYWRSNLAEYFLPLMESDDPECIQNLLQRVLSDCPASIQLMFLVQAPEEMQLEYNDLLKKYQPWYEYGLTPDLLQDGYEFTEELVLSLEEVPYKLQRIFAKSGCSADFFNDYAFIIMEDALQYISAEEMINSADRFSYIIKKVNNNYYKYESKAFAALCRFPEMNAVNCYHFLKCFSEDFADLCLNADIVCKPWFIYAQDFDDLEHAERYHDSSLAGINEEILDKIREKSDFNEYHVMLHFLSWAEDPELFSQFSGKGNGFKIMREFMEDYTDEHLFVLMTASFNRKKQFLDKVLNGDIGFINCDKCSNLFNYSFITKCYDLDSYEGEHIPEALYDVRFKYDSDTMKYLGSEYLTEILQWTSEESKILQLIDLPSNSKTFNIVSKNLARNSLDWYMQQENWKSILSYDYDWDTESVKISDFIIRNEITDLRTGYADAINSDYMLEQIKRKLKLTFDEMIEFRDAIIKMYCDNTLHTICDYYVYDEHEKAIFYEAVRQQIRGQLSKWEESISFYRSESEVFTEWLKLREYRVVTGSHRLPDNADIFRSGNVCLLEVNGSLALISESVEELFPFRSMKCKRFIKGETAYEVLMPASVHSNWSFLGQTVYYTKTVQLCLTEVQTDEDKLSVA